MTHLIDMLFVLVVERSGKKLMFGLIRRLVVVLAVQIPS